MSGTFEGVGSLQFTPDNKFAYAYSGNISLSTTAKLQLDFSSQSEYIVAKIVFTGPASLTNPSGERDTMFRVDLNDTTVAWSHRLAGSSLIGTGETTINIIVPPFTEVKIYADSSGSDSDYYTAVVFTGKVFGAIEQENLESITNNNKWASL